MLNLQWQQWYTFQIFTKLKQIAADRAGCFVACINPLDLKRKTEIHHYVTQPATSSHVPHAIAVTLICRRNAACDWMQTECICAKRGSLKKMVRSIGNQDILSTHQASGVKFLLTFGTTFPRDIEIWAVYDREANVALLNAFKPFVQITLPVFQAIPDGAILQYWHNNEIINNLDKVVSTALKSYLEVSFLLGCAVVSMRNWFLTFQDETTMSSWNVRNQLLSDSITPLTNTDLSYTTVKA